MSYSISRHILFPLLLFTFLPSACSEPAIILDSGISDTREVDVDAEPSTSIVWSCQERCIVDGAPWRYQNNVEFNESIVVFWRTDGDITYIVDRLDDTGTIVLANIEHTFSFETNCVRWPCLPTPNDSKVACEWCFALTSI